MINRFLSLISIFCLFLSGLLSPKAEAKSPEDNNSLLWKISGNGLEKPSYLFGTIHLICQADYLWSDVMEKAFSESEKVCLELDMDDPQLPVQYARHMMLSDGSELKDYFDDTQYSSIINYIQSEESMKMYTMAVSKFKPIALLTILSQNMVSCDASSKTSYEMNLTEKSKAAQKEILGLETIEDQFKALNSMHDDSVISKIIAITSGEQMEEDKDLLDQLTRAYTAQDLNALQELFKKYDSQQSFVSTLLDDRNKNWIPVMEKMMSDHAVFFAVGAGHLPGDNGVINLLRSAGYQVEMIR